MSLILKEKYEIDEMGINISRLKKLQPKGYLTKRIEATKKESGVSSKVRELSNEFKLIIDQIKNHKSHHLHGPLSCFFILG